MTGIQNIDSWSPKMQAPMIAMYGEEYFRKTWSDWVEAFVGTLAAGGDICKGELSKITCPTLIVHGKKDPMVGMEHAEYLHRNIKNSEYVH
jgi:valacyclovir hydrolase